VQGPDTVFTRFSPAAKRVLRSAEQACRNHNHYYVGVGHLLLALLEEHDPRIEARLVACGVTSADIVADLRRAIGTGDEHGWDGILMTPRVSRVIRTADSAIAEPALLEPVDLFDAIITQGGLAAELLSRFLGNFQASQGVAG
jgi:ATP-dependent Clp protease ATP-binding subunit ClpA